MRSAISRTVADHYVWGDGCDGWHLVRTDGLSVIEERMPPGAAEARHLHQHARQFFYVLEGSLTIEHDGSLDILQTGDGLEVPPGVVHEVRNRSGEAVRFLVVSQPPSHGDRHAVVREHEPDGRR